VKGNSVAASLGFRLRLRDRPSRALLRIEVLPPLRLSAQRRAEHSAPFKFEVFEYPFA